MSQRASPMSFLSKGCSPCMLLLAGGGSIAVGLADHRVGGPPDPPVPDVPGPEVLVRLLGAVAAGADPAVGRGVAGPTALEEDLLLRKLARQEDEPGLRPHP